MFKLIVRRSFKVFLLTLWLFSCSGKEAAKTEKLFQLTELQRMSLLFAWNKATIASLKRQGSKDADTTQNQIELHPLIQKYTNEECSLKFPSSRARFIKEIFSYPQLNASDSVKAVYILETSMSGDQVDYSKRLVLDTGYNFRIYFFSNLTGWAPEKSYSKQLFNGDAFIHNVAAGAFSCKNENSYLTSLIVSKIERDRIQSEFVLSPCSKIERAYKKLLE